MPARKQAQPWFRVYVAVFAAALLIAIFAGPIADTDFWWHLRTGQWIAQQHRLPVPDPFAYTTGAGMVARFNLTHEWLAQLAMYGVYAAGGFTGVALARAVLLAAVCGMAGWIAARISQGFWRGILAALAASSVMAAFAADRPALVTFLGVAVFLALLEGRRGVWALPAIALVWANCHSGFFLGWIVVAAYAARDRKLWPVAACTVAASLANPNTYHVFEVLAAYRHSAVNTSLIEWQPPSWWGRPYGFNLLLYGAAAVLAMNWRRVRVEHWIVFLAFAAASLTAFRNLPLLAVIAPALIAAYAAPRIAIPALAVVAATGAMYWRAPDPSLAEWTVPAAAADFAASRQLPGKFFNTYEQGGYWIWRGERVFIDGRALSDRAFEDSQQILFNKGSAADAVTGPRKELLDRYGIETVAMNAIEPASGALYPLALALGNPADEEWQLAYEDTQELVFVRHAPPGFPVLANKFARVLRHLNAECAYDIENAPDMPVCARTLADYWMRNQAWAPARQMLRLYLAHRDDPAAAAALARLP
ncbi:MAG: hypothetical protein JST11_02325 [Acidobacteria bacterium]|nr:hypothetical protein [Acidobacteriota bacterium]